MEEFFGKYFYAREEIPIKTDPFDYRDPHRYVRPGDMVGQVYSYLEPNEQEGRRSPYWLFLGSNGEYFYAEHHDGWYDSLLSGNREVINGTPPPAEPAPTNSPPGEGVEEQAGRRSCTDLVGWSEKHTLIALALLLAILILLLID